jgi:hypothetical protein
MGISGTEIGVVEFSAVGNAGPDIFQRPSSCSIPVFLEVTTSAVGPGMSNPKKE